MKVKFYILGFISSIILIAILAGSFFLGKSSSSSKNEISPTPGPAGSLSTPQNLGGQNLITPTPTIEKFSTKEAIELALNTKDYTNLLDYMSVVVGVRIEASECCGNKTGSGAVDALQQYLDPSGGDWDFDQSSQVAVDLASMYPENYANAIIAISSDNYVVAFQLNDADNIENISMSNNYETLFP